VRRRTPARTVAPRCCRWTRRHWRRGSAGPRPDWSDGWSDDPPSRDVDVRTREFTLRPATDGDRPYVASLLDRNGLPTATLASALDHLWVARADGRRVGGGGVQPCGDSGLLRSVAVESSVRGRGHGTALVAGLERTARADGRERRSPLTTDATGFVAARGYETVDRSAVPDAVRSTARFETVCPASATRMRTEP
jgi:amino-acid N-acetyltransferase